MVLILAKCGKINNAQAARSAVTAVLKKLSQLLGKKSPNCQEKAMTAILRQLSQDSSLLWAKANKVRRVISDCWRGYFMNLAKKW